MGNENSFCPICSSEKDVSFSIEYMNYEFATNEVAQDIFSDLKIHVCKRCGFGWALPSIDKTRLDKFYSDVYRDTHSAYHVRNTVSNYSDFSLEPRPISQILLAKSFKEFKENDTLLDIGCGRGISFWIARKLLPKMRLFAVEPDQFSHPTLKSLGVQLYPIYFDRYSGPVFGSQRFDFILMSHLLEHYNGDEIIPVLQYIQTLLTDDGIFLCEVPNSDLITRRNMRYNDAPHLSFFNETSLRTALEKSGLNLRFMGCCSQKHSEWWEEYIKSTRNGGKQEPADGRLNRISRITSNLFPESPPKEYLKKLYGKLFSTQNVFKFLSSDDFQYGSEGTCIRVIAGKL
ncbi:MAG TPA: class I SAM-dependent methyltransferase [Dehalococcoidia bacterium]|nr:class I SAM-dependent methyltransferase [Dehalococcoidia bacterium]